MKVVLVVDDHAASREAFLAFLDCEGYQGIGAADAAQAFDYLRSTAAPSLIVLDLMLPEMSGAEFADRLKDDPSLSSIPILVYSAGPNVPEVVATMGAAGGLRKPASLPELIDAVERCTNGNPRGK
ncbi:MAG: response regulator [Polyangiaceae bacterium]